MMKKTHINLLWIAISLIATVFVACEDVIQLETPDSEARLIVNGTLTQRNEVQYINLRYSTNYFDTIPSPATGVKVILSDDKGRADILPESPVGSGRYRIDQPGVIGNTYTLEFTLPSGKVYKTLPEKLMPITQVEKLEYQFQNENDDKERSYTILLTANEFPNERNYYRWKLYVNDSLRDEPTDLSFASDEFLQQDRGRVERTVIYFGQFEIGDTLRVEQFSISERYFDFLTLVQLQTAFVGGLFDTAPAPILGNVVNAKDPSDYAFGFFNASAIEEGTVVVEN